MNPIIGNSLSNNCGNPISSNCVTVPDGLVPGICAGSSLTQVLTSVINTANSAGDCCSGVFPDGHVSGYTGQWVDFQPTIPLSGGVPQQYSWVINSFGIPYDNSYGGVTGNENTPQYKWTQQGDLLVRGSFLITVTPLTSNTTTIVPIPLASIPIVNFPTGFTASQTIPVSSTFSAGFPTSGPYVTVVTRGALTLDYPTGILYLNFSYVATTRSVLTDGIFMGGIKFNLA